MDCGWLGLRGAPRLQTVISWHMPVFSVLLSLLRERAEHRVGGPGHPQREEAPWVVRRGRSGAACGGLEAAAGRQGEQAPALTHAQLRQEGTASPEV